MKKTKFIFSFLVIMMAALISSGMSSQSLQTNIIPAEAKWFIHIDVQKFAQTDLKQLIEDNSEQEFGRGIMEIEEVTGIDFFNDISTVTVIGLNQMNEKPVLAFSGKLDKSRLLDLIRLEEEVSEINYAKFLIYTWEDNAYGVFANENLLIFSESRKGLEKVLDTYSGKGKNFSDSPLQKEISALSPNTFLVATAENISAMLDEDDDDFGAQILQKTEAAFFSASEQNSNVKVQLALQTDSLETATNMESMVTGLKAFLSMNDKIDPNWSIIKSLKVSSKGKNVVLESQGSVEELLNIIKKK
jgi:hypothetical protein